MLIIKYINIYNISNKMNISKTSLLFSDKVQLQEAI